MQVNYHDLPDDDGFSPVPVGEYPFQITKLTSKKWDDGTEKGVTVEHTIEGPNYSGRKVFKFFYLNPRGENSDNARRINGARLKKLANACGFSSQNPLTDTGQLLGKRGVVKVGQQKDKRSGDLENVIKDWSQPRQMQGPPGGFPAAQQMPQQVPQANQVPPQQAPHQQAPQQSPQGPPADPFGGGAGFHQGA